MKFGVHFGSRGVAGDPDTLKAIAQKAEALGYEYFGMSDHVIVATDVASAYPYSESGKFYAQDTGVSLEQVTALGFVAAATNRIRLLTSVLVLPHCHPVLVAKMLATVDVLSKGRLIAGVGVGWMAEEIALLGGPPFTDRAKAVEAEVESHILAHADLTDGNGPRLVVRHGYLPERDIQTEFGAVEVRAPRVRDREHPPVRPSRQPSLQQ